ncbi:MAG: hypothetical protein JNG89_03415, partial [Planctomycetaceae bacterium]|nr:hypothetical protein [Planctomycetaceae bacterium]
MTSPGHLDSPRADAEAPVRHSIWRPRGPVGDAARRSLRIRRFVSALVLLALGTLFYTVVVAPFAHPQLRLAALTTVSPEFDTAPSAALQAVPFAEQDLLAWRQLGEDLSPGHDTHLLLDATTPYLAADLEALGGKLRPLSGGEQDILLLYVRTQGVTRNGEPALRCSPQAAGAPAELYPLSRLLDQLRALPQATKLLIVDAGADAVDFDTGMPVNEFPRLVSDAVAETHDSRLWVLLSHGVLETSQVHWSRQRTAFVEALAHGLTGAADTNVDHVVDLDELFRFVSTSVARSTMEISNGQATQTPQLCWGGGERRRSGTAPVIAPVAMTLSLPEVATADGGAPPTDAKAETADAPSSGQVNPFAAVSQLAPVSVTAPSVSVSSASVTAPTLTLPTSLPTAASLISA